MATAQATAIMNSPTTNSSPCDMPSNITRSFYGKIPQGSITG